MAKSLFDVAHPVFRPLWVRVLVTGLVGAWTLFEVTRGSAFFAILFGAATLWLAYKYFIDFDPKDYERKAPDVPPAPPPDA
jgi:hypothetical protein